MGLDERSERQRESGFVAVDLQSVENVDQHRRHGSVNSQPGITGQRFAALIETMQEGCMVHAPDGSVRLFNRKACEILRLNDHQMRRGEHHQVCHAAVREDGTPLDAADNPVQQAFDSGKPVCNMVIGLRIGVWLSVNTTPIFGHGDASASEVMCTFTDITKNVVHRKRIHTQQRWLDEAQRIARLGSWTWQPATQRVWWSDSIYELFGVDKETTIPGYEAFLALVHPEDRHTAIERVEAMLAGANEFASDLRIIRPDQGCLWIHSRARARRDRNGEIVLVEGIDQDITERKLTEQALTASQQRLSLALKAAGAITFEWEIAKDRVIRHFSVDPGLPANTDGPPSFQEARKIVHPDDLPQFDAAIRQCLEYGQGSCGDYNPLLRVRRDDGSYAWFQSWGAVQRDAAGKPVRLVGIAANVTERMQADEELKQKSALLSVVANGTTDAVFVKDLQGRYLFANQAMAKFMGRTMEDIIGSTDEQLFDAGSAEVVKNSDGLVKLSQDTVLVEETLTLAGATRTFLASKGPYLNANGEVVGVFGISRDITDRKETERALSLTQCSVDHSRDSIFWINAELRFVYANHAAYARLGYQLDELLQMTYGAVDDRFSQARYEECVARLRDAGAMQFESQHRTNDGRLLDVEVNCSYITFDGQEIVCLIARDVTERKKTLRKLQLTQFSVEHVTDIIIWLTPEGKFVNANQAACDKLGYSLPELLEMQLWQVDSSASPDSVRQLWEQLLQAQSFIYHTQFETKGRQQLDVEITSNYFEYEGRAYACSIVRDISDRKLIEERLRMSQKMEAIGQLAGGIAHDFNNLLTVINCHSQLLLDLTDRQDPYREHYAAIQHAGNRAAELTSQLLTFSRRKVTETKVVDVNEVVRSSARLLTRLLREDIELEIDLDEQLEYVLADHVELERIILNLAVNARDAMLDGGKLCIRTADQLIDQSNRQHYPDLPLGHYASLAVSDTGRGMADEIRPRIFEPFFTTKEIGAGTGLGLAVVHGIVQQYGGHVVVESALDQGTTFRVLLPSAGKKSELSEASEDGRHSAPRAATVLVVDDDAAVQQVVRSVLERHGCSVLAAPSGPEAMRLIQTTPPGGIDVLLTDVVMPNMKGDELARKVQEKFPAVTTIFMSGYNEAMMTGGIAQEELLRKPFTPSKLLSRVRTAISQ